MCQGTLISTPRSTYISNLDPATVENGFEIMLGMLTGDHVDPGVKDAFRSLKSNPDVKRAVSSAVCDKTVLRAVANNSEVQKLIHKAQQGDHGSANGGRNVVHEAPKIGQRCITDGNAEQKPSKWKKLWQDFLDFAKALFEELKRIGIVLLQELLGSTSSEKQSPYDGLDDGDGLDDHYSSIVFTVTFLSIMLLVFIGITVCAI